MKLKGLSCCWLMLWRIVLAVFMVNLFFPMTAQAEGVIYAGQFSAANPDDRLPTEWKPLVFKKITSHTRYSLVKDGTTLVIKAISNASASGLIRKIRINPEKYPVIQWRWKAANILNKGDVTEKAGDDYAARVYVTFEYDPERTSLFDKAMIQLGRLIHGEHPPIATINYIWANKAPMETIVPSPYTKLDMMIVVETGKESLNHWVLEERNIFNDFVTAFGKKPPMISGVAIMTDSDNTKESAIAFYGDILFKQR
ncbi:MAG: DUF3047 domain-containing protein [Desulfobacterales bacterium]|nr:MAG: DUF3047 domain-containing protein [Desulfobacterales bacterium]